MSDYKTMYYQLTAKVADAIELLVSAQQEVENFVEANEQSNIIHNDMSNDEV